MIPNRLSTLAVGVTAFVLSAGAFAKGKSILPPYILQAHTVAVLIDPDAGMSIEDPRANDIARNDVEAALQSWGRFSPVLGVEQADLIIVVRKGSGKMADATISNPRQNDRSGSVTSTDNGLSIGAQHGQQAGSASDASNGSIGLHPQMEVGMPDDSFVVYQGGRDDPLDAPAGWRWVRKNALHPHDVPAVQEFRKAIEEAEKQAAKHP
jgi:hypothetical protein